MDEIKAMLSGIMETMDAMAEKIDEMSERLDSLTDEVQGLTKGDDENEVGVEVSLDDIADRIEELADEIELLRGCGPDDSITDICNKLSVIIKAAGYEDDTLGLGMKVIIGDGSGAKEAVITKYDADGMEVEYVN